MSATPFPNRYLFLTASSREGGNSEQLARHAASFLPRETAQQWVSLADHPLPPFVDLRHIDREQAGYPMPQGAGRYLLDATLAATDVVVVTPLYWYSLPATAKLWLDHWTSWLNRPELGFRSAMRGKTLWAVVVSAGSSAEAAPLAEMLRLTADYMEMDWGGMLLGNGSRPGDVRHDEAAWEYAASFLSESVSSPR